MCWCAAIGALLTVGARPVGGAIVGDIVRVGYQGTTAPVIRIGAWTPIVVDLSLHNQTSFDGILRVRQLDRDGDVYFHSVPVQLFAEGGAQKTYWLYAVANPGGTASRGLVVELLDTEDGNEQGGRIVEVISGGKPTRELRPPADPNVLTGDQLLILYVKDGTIGKIRQLLGVEFLDRFARQVEIAHASPGGLPNQWIGLEMVDAIVWDEADPTALTVAQQQAVIEWIRQGGTLIMAAGRTASAVAQSDQFGPLLPVKVGPVRSTIDLSRTKDRLINDPDDPNTSYIKPVTVAQCQLVADTSVTSLLDEESLGSTLIASRRVGRGRFVFVAAALDELLRDATNVVGFYEKLLELRRNPVTSNNTGPQYISLFRYLDRQTGFYGTSSLRLGLALIFSIAYALLATLGAWKFLSARNMLRHSWTALAIVAVLASVASVIGVQLMHGVGRDVHQLVIVDGAAGSVDARATAYFGLTTGVHSRLDAWVPRDHVRDDAPQRSTCTLRPMPDWRDLTAEDVGFTDPGRYQLEPATAEVRDVPVRATLKQFEGRWEGVLDGTIHGSLAMQREALPATDNDGTTIQTWIPAPNSWIQNDLPVDLQNCYLIIALYDAVQPQTFQTVAAQRALQGNIRAYPLGVIKSGERVNLYRELCLGKDGNLLAAAMHNRHGLDRVQRAWGRSFAEAARLSAFGDDQVQINYSLEHFQNAVLLLTVLSDIDPSAFAQSIYGGQPMFSRARCRQLDLSSLLTSRSAILVGFSDDPGPVRLDVRSGERQYKTVDPDQAWTVYRFVIPVDSGR